MYSDTVSRVGVFCSVVNSIEMCKAEGVVDVFQVVKALRIQKPGAVLAVVCSVYFFQNILTFFKPMGWFILYSYNSLQDQYRHIFDILLLFLDSFSIYSNFK